MQKRGRLEKKAHKLICQTFRGGLSQSWGSLSHLIHTYIPYVYVNLFISTCNKLEIHKSTFTRVQDTLILSLPRRLDINLLFTTGFQEGLGVFQRPFRGDPVLAHNSTTHWLRLDPFSSVCLTPSCLFWESATGLELTTCQVGVYVSGKTRADLPRLWKRTHCVTGWRWVSPDYRVIRSTRTYIPVGWMLRGFLNEILTTGVPMPSVSNSDPQGHRI